MRHTYKKLKTLLKYCELKSASSHSLPQPFSVPLTPSKLLSPFFPILLTLSQFCQPLPNFADPFPIALTLFQFCSPFPNFADPIPISLTPSQLSPLLFLSSSHLFPFYPLPFPNFPQPFSIPLNPFQFLSTPLPPSPFPIPSPATMFRLCLVYIVFAIMFFCIMW